MIRECSELTNWLYGRRPYHLAIPGTPVEPEKEYQKREQCCVAPDVTIAVTIIAEITP